MFVVKNSPEMVNKTFRLPADLVKQLGIVASSQGVSMNNLVQQCCQYALNDMPDGMELKRKKG